jgi:4-aminobutyrate aminotransferase-like enzyme
VIGRAALQVVFEEGMIENSKNKGEFMLEHMKKIFKKQFITDVRGRGLFIGVE